MRTNSQVAALMKHATPFLPGLSPVAGKALTATFDAGRLSSDGGVTVLREIAARFGPAQAITSPLTDTRDPSRVGHSYAEIALARMVLIAAGYEDCDDADALRSDPAFSIALGGCPGTGADLMIQPTLSRLENLAGWRGMIERDGDRLTPRHCLAEALGQCEALQ